jgi:glyoxylase-like metal-dependent hydrolase (beta-lactamase superfamily II)
MVEVAPGVHVIPDPGVALVPNVGVVEGAEAVLIVDAGMGPRNGERVLAEVRGLTAQTRRYATLTHFHPEHGFGAQALRDHATLLYNAPQKAELDAKGAAYVELFRTFGPHVAEQLEGVELVDPHLVYPSSATLDLGGLVVELLSMPAHTLGDQVVWIPERRVLFAGDLAENGMLPIVPDGDVRIGRWIAVLERLERLRPEIVVGGHGAVGGVELLARARDYLTDLRARVVCELRSGAGDDEIVAALEPALAADYAGWGGHEWIEPAIRCCIAEVAD